MGTIPGWFHLAAMKVPYTIALAGVRALARVDYAVANKVTDGVADVAAWAYAHDAPVMAETAVRVLQTFDQLGGILIAIVVWLAHHAHSQ